MAKHRLYLDTHYIDYLWDHRQNVWNGPLEWSQSRFAARGVSAPSEDDFVSLEAFHDLCFLNDWRIVIGDQVLRELSNIADTHRRKELVGYAKTLQSIESTLGLDLIRPDEQDAMDSGDMGLGSVQMSLWPGIDPPQVQRPRSPLLRAHLLRSIRSLPASDQPLVEEAVELNCDVFLSTDARLQKKAAQFQGQGLRVQSWLDFLVDELAGEQDHVQNARTTWPDISAYSIAIPSGIE
jgi:hypothetical protein